MILIWNGEEIEAIELDKEIPGPRAREIARHLEPGYLRGYLEGRKVAVGFQELRSKGKLGKGYRQIRSLMAMTCYDVPTESPWRYAMYLKEKMLEQVGTTSGNSCDAPPVTTQDGTEPKAARHPEDRVKAAQRSQTEPKADQYPEDGPKAAQQSGEAVESRPRAARRSRAKQKAAQQSIARQKATQRPKDEPPAGTILHVSPRVKPGDARASPPVGPGDVQTGPPVRPGDARASPPVRPGSVRAGPGDASRPKSCTGLST